MTPCAGCKEIREALDAFFWSLFRERKNPQSPTREECEREQMLVERKAMEMRAL
jgi:hypothetical protein